MARSTLRRVRTFIGIDPGKNIRDRLVWLQENLIRDGAEAKWVEVDNLHVTLLFLGEVEMTDLPGVCTAVSEVIQKHASFSMAVEKTGCFPNIRRPRVIWVGIGAGSQAICDLHDDLEGPLMDLGCYRREERKYTPHLTLGRVRGERGKSQLSTTLARYENWQAGEVDVTEILVMSSELTPQGPVYTVVSRAKLS